jgi:hypothetical protein
MADAAPMRPYEGSEADKRADKLMAKKRKLTLKQWERTKEDRRMDAAAARATVAAGRR